MNISKGNVLAMILGVNMIQEYYFYKIYNNYIRF